MFNPAERRDKRGRWVKSLDSAIKGDAADLERLVRADRGPTRNQMPQLSGVPIPGSKADRIPHKPGGEVDLTDQFEKELRARGIKVSDTSVPVEDLKPTQDELVMDKVIGLAKYMLTAPKDSPVWEPIFVSRDNHVIDGHHRWAGRIIRDRINGTHENMAVRKVDLDIKEAMAEASKFMDKWGLPREGVTGDTGPLVSNFSTYRLKGDVDLTRHVATPAGAQRYHLPIGAPITAHGGEDRLKELLAKPVSAMSTAERQEYVSLYDKLHLKHISTHTGKRTATVAEVEKALAPANEPLANTDAHVTLKDKPTSHRVKPPSTGYPPNPKRVDLGQDFGRVSMDRAVNICGDNYGWSDRDSYGAVEADMPSVDQQERAQIVAQSWDGNYQPSDPEASGYARSVWEEYQNPASYGALNAALRTGKADDSFAIPVDKLREYANLMFKEGGWTTEKPMKVYRALKSSEHPPSKDGKTLPGYHDWSKELTPGTVFTDNGIVSSTAHSKFAAGWLEQDPQGQVTGRENPHDVVLEINIPAGTRIVGGNVEFIETMLQPGSRFKITASTPDKVTDAVSPVAGPDSMASFRYTHVVADYLPPEGS